MRLLIIFISIVAFVISTMGLLVNEKFFLLFVVDLGIVLITFMLLKFISNRKIRIAAESDGALDAVVVDHIEGLEFGRLPCEIRNYPDRIEIIEKVNNRKYSLSHTKLKAIEIKNEQEFIDLDRSVVGRAIVGNLLVPGLGAIIGGMSGLKSKKKGQLKNYLILNYTDNSELKGITFETGFNAIRSQSFMVGVNQKIGNRLTDRTVEL